jgi:hypothetical protein
MKGHEPKLAWTPITRRIMMTYNYRKGLIVSVIYGAIEELPFR